jgi:hypothetical protein
MFKNHFIRSAENLDTETTPPLFQNFNEFFSWHTGRQKAVVWTNSCEGNPTGLVATDNPCEFFRTKLTFVLADAP